MKKCTDYGVIPPLNTVKHWNSVITSSEDGENWLHSGWSGDFAEPFRHWCKYPSMEGIYSQIWDFIEPDLDLRGLVPQRVIVNAYNHGDSSWLHRDSELQDHYTVILYLNNDWDWNWGGETIVITDGGDIIMSVFPTPGRVIAFDSRLLHGPRPVSREAPLPRLGVTFQCSQT